MSNTSWAELINWLINVWNSFALSHHDLQGHRKEFGNRTDRHWTLFSFIPLGIVFAAMLSLELHFFFFYWNSSRLYTVCPVFLHEWRHFQITLPRGWKISLKKLCSVILLLFSVPNGGSGLHSTLYLIYFFCCVTFMEETSLTLFL